MELQLRALVQQSWLSCLDTYPVRELQNIVKIQCFSITMSSYLHKKLDFFVFDSQSNCYFFVELLVFGVGGKLVIVASKFIVCSRHQFREQILHY